MLWIAGRFCDSEERRKEIVLAACACARTALRYVPKGEKRPVECIRTAERWARGRATLEEVCGARNAAYAAHAAAYAAAYAAHAAAYAAHSAAAYAAHSAAAYAAYAAHGAVDVRAKALANMAKMVRAKLTMPNPPAERSAKMSTPMVLP
jgi:hypothetical protein